MGLSVEIGYSGVREVDMRIFLPAQCCCEPKSILKTRERERPLSSTSPSCRFPPKIPCIAQPLLSSTESLSLALFSESVAGMIPTMRVSCYPTSAVSQLPAVPPLTCAHLLCTMETCTLDWAQHMNAVVHVDL